MHLRISYLFVFLFILLFSGCTQKEDAPWNTKTTPTVFSVITPGSPVQVYVGKSYVEGDTTKTNPFYPAQVFICGSDNNWIELKPSTDSTIYFDSNNSITVQKGNTYSLRIELKDVTLRARTTVPNESGTITQADCVVKVYSDANSYGGVLNVRYVLPSNKDLGCYLFALSREYGMGTSLTGGFYQEQDFYIPSDSTSFLLNLITVDPYLNKFRIAQNITSMQSSIGISALLGSYSGVRPTFSNIENGIGLFGSYVVESKKIVVTKVTN